MVNIIFEDKGLNYQVPGLPYEDTFKYVRPVLLNGIPTPDDLAALLASSDADTLTNPWSVGVVQGFKDYIPTTFRRITKNMPEDLMQEYFNIGQEAIPEGEKILLQLQTEIEAKGATIDAAIVHGRRELGTVVNKAHILNRLYMIGRIYGHLEERKYPFLFGDLESEENWDTALSQMKMQFIEYLNEIPIGPRAYPIRRRNAEVTEKEITERFPYVNWIREKLGNDLLGILLYGSASRTADPSQFSDYDNWVVVKNVPRAHRILKGTMPSVYLDKIVEGDKSHNLPNTKHVGIHLFPESSEYLERHIRFLHDSTEFLKHTLVLDGRFDFPVIAEDEVVERGISHAYVKLKTISGSLNWAYSTPEKIIGKPNLFEFIVKNIRFFLQHSLNAMHEPKFRDKEELDALLAERGMPLPGYKPDPKYIQESLLFSMTSVLRLQQDLIEFGRSPNLEFLLDNNQRDPSHVNDWGSLDDEAI